MRSRGSRPTADAATDNRSGAETRLASALPAASCSQIRRSQSPAPGTCNAASSAIPAPDVATRDAPVPDGRHMVQWAAAIGATWPPGYASAR